MLENATQVQKRSAGEKEIVEMLCALSLNPSPSTDTLEAVASLDEVSRNEFLRLADSNHVIVRGLEPVIRYATMVHDQELLEWATDATVLEKARVENALLYLHAICAELENAGCPVTV